MKAGLRVERRWSAGKFEFCLLISAVGGGERRENFVLYDGHLNYCEMKGCLTRWSEHVQRAIFLYGV